MNREPLETDWKKVMDALVQGATRIGWEAGERDRRRAEEAKKREDEKK